MKQEELENIKFVSVEDALPETNGNQAFVYMKKSDGSITRGMFYMNGRQASFASYGSKVDGVIAWAYK